MYVNDTIPGLTRLKSGKGFRYRNTSGQAIKDPEEIRRIQKLAIPPAYTRVWICPTPNGHLQATGYDARGRKQYRYHADWQDRRNDSKFERLLAFGHALPRIRARVARDLAPRRNAPVSRSLVLATLVRLLDTTFVRVGNDEYARDNGSYGLTTLRNPHAGVRGKTLQLRFRGKSGVMQDLKVDDPKVAAVVRRCQQLPGQLLFQYETEGEGGDKGSELRAVGSGDVNDYLAEITRGKTAAMAAAITSPPRISAPGTALCRHWSSPGWLAARTARATPKMTPRQAATAPKPCWRKSPACSATRRPSARSPTFIRQCWRWAAAWRKTRPPWASCGHSLNRARNCAGCTRPNTG
jgi:hypothetical protein